MDVLLLSRLQFSLTIMFHYLFPPLTIGLGIVLVFLEWRWIRTGDQLYHTAGKFWTRMFGLNFALGVATGIVMEFQFGTNWAVYSRFVGDVFGSALAAEGIFAFFLESGFLSILLFGWDRVSKPFHFFATCMVSLGSIFSSIWIVVANSWQQTPAGFHLVTKTIGDETFTRAEITDFWQLVFNPSTVDRLVHVWLGALILGAFFVMSISAWYLLKNRHIEFAKHSFRGALLLGTLASLGQLVSGHSNANMIAEHQPAKLAAFEGHFETGEGGSPLYVVGWPDAEQKTTSGIAIPGMLSFLVYNDFNKPVPALDQLEDTYGSPPIWLSFQSYHIMVAFGMMFIISTLFACLCLWRGTLFNKRWLLWCFVFGVIPAIAANELGWVAAEVGRQPWIVYPSIGTNGQMVDGLRTADALSEVVKAEQVLTSIIMFGFVYVVLLILWLFLLDRKIKHGPEPEAGGPEPPHGDMRDAAAAMASHRGTLTGDREGS
ncbi:MAG: cytochrome ubiquinol oxidase subunit I [Phycisphaerae bacterium]|nr:cytochrome ubiquinol oxidase subunit I [Phycisphaerae bacterium]